MAVEQNIFDILTENNVDYDVIEHEAVYTCDIAAELAGHDMSKGIKSIIMKKKPGGEFILVCLPGNKRIDSKKMIKITLSKKIRFATAEEVKELTGLSIGCCCPFGYTKEIKTYIDKELFSKEHLYFNPGSHTKTIKIKSEDLRKLVNGIEFE